MSGAQKREKRHDPAFAAIVSAQNQDCVFQCDTLPA
jgi:hypothetical protein